jgi:SAM-dependent methyltransferase
MTEDPRLVGDLPEGPAASNWSRLDDTGHAGEFVQYLDAADTTPEILEWKQHGLRLLQLRPGLRVLEAGCGPGFAARMMARMVAPGGSVLGLDKSATMIEQAVARGGDDSLLVEFRQGDIHALELPDESFDRSWADRTFQHLEDPTRAIAELTRVTRRGGRVVVSDPDWGTGVLSGADPGVSERISRAIERTVRNGRIARDMPGLFADSGLVDIEVLAIPYTSRDLAGLTPDQHPFFAAAIASREMSGLSDTELRAWIDKMTAGIPTGRMLIAGLGFAVGGVKP